MAVAIKIALVLAAAFVSVWLLGAFINWDIYPGNWTYFGRISAVLVGATMAALAIIEVRWSK